MVDTQISLGPLTSLLVDAFVVAVIVVLVALAALLFEKRTASRCSRGVFKVFT